MPGHLLTQTSRAKDVDLVHALVLQNRKSDRQLRYCFAQKCVSATKVIDRIGDAICIVVVMANQETSGTEHPTSILGVADHIFVLTIPIDKYQIHCFFVGGELKSKRVAPELRNSVFNFTFPKETANLSMVLFH